MTKHGVADLDLEKFARDACAAEKTRQDAYDAFRKLLFERAAAAGAEIGVAFGGNAESILSVGSVTKLYGVDPYRHRAGCKDPLNLLQSDFDAQYHYALSRLTEFGRRYEHIRKPSRDAAADVGEKIDFVHIDAENSYDALRDDLNIWTEKVRVGGIIAGRDYGNPAYPGVKQAVDDYFAPFGTTVTVLDGGVWWAEMRSRAISFFMPAYNCEKTIEASVESIMEGNFGEGDELIIVNDASTDMTAAAIERVQRRYPGTIVLTHEKNKGGAAARNTAVEHARNELLFCLDSDNLLVAGRVSALKNRLLQSAAHVALFEEFKYFKNIPSDSTETVRFPPVMTPEAYFRDTTVPGASGNYLFTKHSWKMAGGYPEFAGALDTWGFGFRQIVTGARMVTLPGSWYFHRYGYDSYFTREARKEKIPLVAIQIVAPYFHIFEERSIRYMTSKKGRRCWFYRVKKHPIYLKREYRRGQKGEWEKFLARS
jgi:glycosyltransferase involved in cell wall biosynthesis